MRRKVLPSLLELDLLEDLGAFQPQWLGQSFRWTEIFSPQKSSHPAGFRCHQRYFTLYTYYYHPDQKLVVHKNKHVLQKGPSYLTFSSSSANPELGRGCSSLSRDAQTPLALLTSSSFSSGSPRRSQANWETSVSPACPGSSLGPPTGGIGLEHLSWEATRWHAEPMPVPPQLAPLNAEGLRLYLVILVWEISKVACTFPPESGPTFFALGSLSLATLATWRSYSGGISWFAKTL